MTATLPKTVGVGVVGCGLIGKRRAHQAALNAGSHVVAVTDTSVDAARAIASELKCDAVSDWRAIVADSAVDAVIVSTPNAYLAEVSMAALEAGKHVLLEKPMGRNVGEARRIADAAQRAGRIVKVGFNHRYHPAIAEAHTRFSGGEIGTFINARGRYGHGGRPGYEREWRGNPELAGGGELTDQGVHLLDLLHWFAGEPLSVFGATQRAIWPIDPLEDNGFAILRYEGGATAMFHTSWTQWKNLFSLEIFGTAGELIIDGIGGSYGTERLTIHRRRPEGGAPETSEQIFEGPDDSWSLEWQDFLGALNGEPFLGTAADGVAVMSALDAIYRSATEQRAVTLA